MKIALHTKITEAKRTRIMAKEETLQRKFHEIISKFEKTMEEIRLLKCVSQDLKNYQKMIKLKKYD